MVSVSIIFVNYKSKEDDIKTCLSSLYKQTLKDFEIVFVDNDSKDNSVNFVRKNFPKVRIIKSKKNLGFASGNNLGVKNARGKYVLILNLDTEIDKNCLKQLVECAEKHENSAINSKIMLFSARNIINTTGTAFNYLGFGWCDNMGKNDKDFLEEREVTFPSGAAFLISKNMFEELGGFDGNYFFYCEDSDLGWRLRLKGYKVFLAPKAKIYHKYFFGKHPQKFYFAERNRIVTILKNYQLKTLILILPPLLLTEIGLLFYSLANGMFFSKLKGYYWILKNINKIYKNRIVIQKTRKISDRDITKYFSSRIEFKEIKSPLIEHFLNPILDSYWNIIKYFI